MEIKKLFIEAKNCTKCYEDKGIEVPLPDPKNGQSNVKIMFVNERPGRIGTGESGYISFDNNDPTARQFKECFEQIGVNRSEIFITNACLCYPSSKDYRDTTPSTKFLKNCHYWLSKQIDIMNPKLIVTLGNTPLKSMKLYFKESEQLKKYKLNKNIGEIITDTKIKIFPLYHTAQRARRYRPKESQLEDWKKINEILQQ